MASNAIVGGAMARGRITARDVVTMRRAYSTDVAITEGEVHELFQLNADCPKQVASWKDFFAETIAGFVLDQKTAEGGISESNAKWLAQRIGGKAKLSDAERAVLRALKDAAPKSDPALFALIA